MLYASRNDAFGFAARTRKNLQYIQKARDACEDVHIVTQLANSLLGLVVFPQERNFVAHVETLTLEHLVSEGWPQWEISKGTCDTLGELIRHLRNAVAHGRITFSSDSRDINDVAITVEDAKPRAEVSHWCASIPAADLRSFCLRFIQLLEDTVG